MFTKQQFLDSIQHETRVCQHLFSKLNDRPLDFRPTPGQRSTLELLQYLTICCQVPIQALLTGDWNQARADIEKIKSLSVDQFNEAMDRQCQNVQSLLASISEDDLLHKEALLPMGRTSILGAALVNFPLKFIAAYRMQLFLYLKLMGAHELVTSNCWFGMDKPK